MMDLPRLKLALAYLLGGVTFLPLILLLLLLFSYLALPVEPPATVSAPDVAFGVEDADSSFKEKHEIDDQEPAVAAGYFAVCREYAPGGLNGKPPERMTPAGETISAESPKLYASLYRSMFERKTAQPTVEAGKAVKKARNVFYVVLRHGHLMLFDHEDQLEVRHVVSLIHYMVGIQGEHSAVPEGELWIKRNCIKLAPRGKKELSAPYFLFSDSCSEKEDFYHALLRSQRSLLQAETRDMPEPLSFHAEDMIKLIRQLHVSEENVQTRWLNALIGRLFLAVYRTSFLENIIASKIRKKISRVNKPAFISSLALQSINLGDAPPTFINPRLREMGVDGTVVLEVDVRYSGNFKAVVAAVARIEVPRFKAREVDLVLAVTLSRLEGHLLIMIKPPPSNRFWITFEVTPRVEVLLQPIISSRQITYGFILQAIKSRILEVIGETLVLPNWDDVPFTKTEHCTYRGGIWKDPESDGADGDLIAVAETMGVTPDNSFPRPSSETSVIDLPLEPPTSAKVEVADSPTPLPSVVERNDKPSPPLTPPFPIRSQSFTTAGGPSPAVVTRVPISSELNQKRRGSHQTDAQTAIRSLSSQSPESSPQPTPLDKPGPELASRANSKADNKPREISTIMSEHQDPNTKEEPVLSKSTNAGSSVLTSTGNAPFSESEETPYAQTGQPHNRDLTPTQGIKSTTLNQSITSATAAAKRWGLGLGALQRQNEPKPSPLSAKTMRLPMGRGNPLPPPGQPLPGPQSRTWPLNSPFTLTRKPLSSKIPQRIEDPTRKQDTNEDHAARSTSIPSTSTLDALGDNVSDQTGESTVGPSSFEDIGHDSGVLSGQRKPST